jgi:hypothetical protein
MGQNHIAQKWDGMELRPSKYKSSFSVVITCFGYLEGLGRLRPTHVGEVVIRHVAFAPQDVNGNDTQQAAEFHPSSLP